MKLIEAFEKYSDDRLMKRPYMMFGRDIAWLKDFHAWGNEDARKLGFMIPDSMIEDANANDWEEVKE